MAQITKDDLERIVDRLNNIFGLKRKYIKSKAEYKGKEFAISGAYGKVKLVVIGKGERNIIGFSSKRELYEQMLAFENGVEAYKNKSFFKK